MAYWRLLIGVALDPTRVSALHFLSYSYFHVFPGFSPLSCSLFLLAHLSLPLRLSDRSSKDGSTSVSTSSLIEGLPPGFDIYRSNHLTPLALR